MHGAALVKSGSKPSFAEQSTNARYGPFVMFCQARGTGGASLSYQKDVDRYRTWWQRSPMQSTSLCCSPSITSSERIRCGVVCTYIIPAALCLLNYRHRFGRQQTALPCSDLMISMASRSTSAIQAASQVLRKLCNLLFWLDLMEPHPLNNFRFRLGAARQDTHGIERLEERTEGVTCNAYQKLWILRARFDLAPRYEEDHLCEVDQIPDSQSLSCSLR